MDKNSLASFCKRGGFLQKTCLKVLTILLWAGIIINVARVRQTKHQLMGD